MAQHLNGPSEQARIYLQDFTAIRDASKGDKELWKFYDDCVKAYTAVVKSLEALQEYLKKG